MNLKETWLEPIPENSSFPIEFEFAANKTGYIYQDGTVFFNDQGMNQYLFKNRQDAFAYFWDDEPIEYQHSFYIGSRDVHPTLDGWCKRMGVATQQEEDGSAVFSAWKTVIN